MMPPFVLGWWRLLRRRWVIGLALFAVTAAAGVAFVLLSRPVHRAEARLRLGEPPPMSGVSPTAGFVGLLRMGGDPFANDLEVLASRTLAERVVDDAALHVRLVLPRGWHRDDVLASVHAGRSTTEQSYRIAWTDDAVIITPRTGAPLRARPGDEVEFGDVHAVFLAWRPGMPREVALRTVPHGQAARELAGQLAVERTRRDANVVRLRFQAADPALARAVVASTVTRFIELRTGLLKRESGETTDSLRGVAQRARSDLAQAEQALEAHQRNTGLVAPDAQAEAAIERYSAAVGRLETARIELGALEQALSRSGAAAEPGESWGALLSYPRFLASSTVGDLLTNLLALENERRDLSRRRTPDNVELRTVLDQIAHLDGALRSIAVDVAATVRGEITALEQQVASMRRELASVPANAIELGRRQRELRLLSEVVVLTEQRLRQEELRQALTFANVQVIDEPALRDRPVWPRRKLGSAVALLLAGVTALVGMVVVERADAAVRTATQVRTALGAPVLAVVNGSAAAPAMLALDAAALIRRATQRNGGTPHIAVIDVAGGSVAERAARALQAHLSTPDVALETLHRADGFGAAAEAAIRQVPLIVAIEVGTATSADLARTAGLLREAGAQIDGAVMICHDAAESDEVWS